jgi:outer membrane lipoprotein-sorting protein
MKRFLWIALAAGLFLPLGSAQTVDEIIAKNVQARGGLEKLHALKTLRLTARISEDDLRAKFVQDMKRDDKIRRDFTIQGMSRVESYDGHSAWRINPFGGRKDPELISAEDSKSLVDAADIEGPLVDYKQKGHAAELLGHDSVEGTDCYKIKLTLKSGNVRLYYLDADSFIEVKYESQTRVRGAIRYTETLLGDYEQVGGVYFPFAIESGPMGSEERTRFTVEKIELDVPLDDSLFSVPPAKSETKPAAASR